MKRLIASVLITVMLIALLPMHTSANIQLPVENFTVVDVSADKGYHPITGQAMLSPKVTLGWSDPSAWDPGNGGDGDDGEEHDPERYLIEVTDTSANTSNTITLPYSDADPSKLYTISNLQAATLYQFQVIPEHTHLNLANDEVPIRSSFNETVYVMTDIEVELEATDNSIVIKFDDVSESNVVYRINYAQVDYQEGDPRSKFENSSKKYQIDITESQTTKDSQSGQLVYTISENIEPGQPYAVTVEPILDLGTTPVVYNTQPNIYPIHTTIYFQAIDEGEYIRFEWDISESFKINDGKHDLVNTTIYEYVDGATEGQVIVEFPGQNGSEVDYYKIQQKQGSTLEYQLVLEYSGYDEPVTSERIMFVPNQTIVEPTRPSTVQPYPKSVDEYLHDFLVDPSEIKGEVGAILEGYMDAVVDGGLGLSAEGAIEKLLRERYLIEGDSYEAENLNALYDENRTFHILPDEEKINFTWSSFRYQDFDATSSTYGQTVTDFDVYYDIWITNDFNGLSTAMKAVEDQKYTKGLNEEMQIINSDGDVLGFSYILDQYYDAEDDEMKDLVPGQVYYIQVVAKKEYAQEFVISDPEITSIYYSYDGDAFAPPTMSSPPLEVIDVSTTTAELEWAEEWYEILSVNPEDSSDPYTQITTWNHEVWSDGTYLYADPITGGQHFEIFTQDDIQQLKDYIGTDEFNNNYIYRKIDMGSDPYGVSDVKYQLLRLDYEIVEKELKLIREIDPAYTLTQYVEELMEKEKNDQVVLDWQLINVTRDPIDSNVITYEQTGLQPNEIYLFLLKPYREMENGDILISYFPATAVAKTLEEEQGFEPKPTVPYLEVVSGYSDMEMKLIWDYNDAFEYTIRYGVEEDVTKATTIDWDISDDYDTGNIPSFIDDYSIIINDLFPDTTYFFWIQATSKANGVASNWSSPVMRNTIGLDAPQPPKGVGMGSRERINQHDIDEPIGKDYITVEWLLDFNDTYGQDTNTDAKVTKQYSYILEVADNPIFLDATRVEITDESVGSGQGNVKILDKNLVLIQDLIANRIYYIRMKTKVTVSMPEIDREIVKESYKYSPTIFLVTSVTGDEYDGTIDPSKEILPGDDYEYIYDKEKKQLEFRFRSNEDKDNNVDQRLIADLINNHSNEYVIDISSYKKEPIDIWVVTIPDTIMQAFMEQQVDVVVNAGDIVLELPFDTFSDVASTDSYRYGADPTMMLTIDKLSDREQKDNMPQDVEEALSSSYDMTLNVSNHMTSYGIVYAAERFEVNLRPNSRYEFIKNEADAYVYNPETNRWSREEGILEMDEGLVSFETEIVGSYALFMNKDTITNLDHWSEPYRKEVLKTYNIRGYEKEYNPDAVITGENIGNIILGLVNGEKDIQIDNQLYEEEIIPLLRAGIIHDESELNGSVSRLQAVEMLVKTYELLDGEPLYVSASLSEMEQLVDKAYAIELINGKVLERPDEALTYGELFVMLNAFID